MAANGRLKRVVITGLGVVAPNGTGHESFWRANLAGTSGIGRLTRFDPSPYQSQVAAEVSDFAPAQWLPPDLIAKTDRFVQLGLAAARMAVQDAQLDLGRIDHERMGVCVGSGLGGILFHEEQMIEVMQRKVKRAHPLSVARIMPNAVAGHLSIELNLLGPNLAVSTACASGLHAIGQAYDAIRLGRADVMLAGGADAPITEFTFCAFDSLRVLSKRNEAPPEASCPFDQRRDGFVMGEGAGIVLLESLEHAAARGAHRYAEIAGYGLTSGGHHMVVPVPDGADAARTMALALREGNLRPADVDYINAHGTSTQANDAAETQAIKRVFGAAARRIPVSSTKSMIGHTIGAAGAIEIIVCSLVLEHQQIPPTANYRTPDPVCDLDYVPNEARAAHVEVALSNSFGFGSSNGCMALRTCAT